MQGAEDAGGGDRHERLRRPRRLIRRGEEEKSRDLSRDFLSVGLLQQHSKHVGVGAVHPELAYRAERSRRSTAKQDRPARRARQLRPDEVDTLEARFRELQHLTNVAREFGITRMTAARLLGERGIDTARRRMSSAEVRAASDSYLDGDSAATIGKRLGFAPHTVIKTLRAAGVEIRPRLGRVCVIERSCGLTERSDATCCLGESRATSRSR